MPSGRLFSRDRALKQFLKTLRARLRLNRASASPVPIAPRRRLFIFDFVLKDARGHFLNFLIGFKKAAEVLRLGTVIYVPSDAHPAIVAVIDARPLLPRSQLTFLSHDDLLERLPTATEIFEPVWTD